jgi:hypothetical protein
VKTFFALIVFWPTAHAPLKVAALKTQSPPVVKKKMKKKIWE